MSDTVHIWSGEYSAFYRHGGHGYTPHASNAGRFKRAVAEDVIRTVGAEKKLAIREIEPKSPDPRDALISTLRADLAAAKEEAGRLRQMLIEDEIAACTGCTSYEFPKRPQCESCIAAVDERIAALAPNP